MKKTFVRPLFIEVRSRSSSLSSRLPSRASMVSRKKFPKRNCRARISSTRLPTLPTEIAFLPIRGRQSLLPWKSAGYPKTTISDNQHDSSWGLTVHGYAGHGGLSQDCPRISQDILESLMDVRLSELPG
jgi:hypothetical protein